MKTKELWLDSTQGWPGTEEQEEEEKTALPRNS